MTVAVAPVHRSPSPAGGPPAPAAQPPCGGGRPRAAAGGDADPDPSLLLSAAVGARAATDRLTQGCVPVGIGRPGARGHVATLPLAVDPAGRRPLCGTRCGGLEPLEERAARLSPLCAWCRRVLRRHRADLLPTRYEHAAYFAAAMLAAHAAGDVQARDQLITQTITAGVFAVAGPWIPGYPDVPLHALIRSWRDLGQYRSTYDALAGRA